MCVAGSHAVQEQDGLLRVRWSGSQIVDGGVAARHRQRVTAYGTFVHIGCFKIGYKVCPDPQLPPPIGDVAAASRLAG